MEDRLVIGGRELKSRFLIGTGKFGNKQVMREAIVSSGAELVTVALRRIDIENNNENILAFIPENITLMINTSGARNAREAVRIARIAREAGYGNWVKIEVINDSRYLLPDNYETVKATEALAADGFIVLPYMNPDLYAARDLVRAGAAAIMPLGSFIGSNQGLRLKILIDVLIEEIDEVPIIVDAGIGLPSHAARAMEAGADAVLVNTAVAVAADPVRMAVAFSKAIEAGRMACLAGAGREQRTAAASSPLAGFLYNE
ncbi:MAG: Thiazole synthase [Syntrophorhabdus sp. PtaU1.Bin058]|nr:MAG: Thiazole synthase [Syntrophorhabdus sp. PtaU1.Bin058]